MAQEANGAEPRKHHYVPQYYLRNFKNEKDMLIVFDRQTKEPYRSKPHGVAAQRDFNRIEIEGMEANAVEKLMAEFEGETAPHLNNVIEKKSLADEKDRAAIVNLMAAMTIRNPKRRKEMGSVMDRATRFLLGKKERYDEYAAEMRRAGKQPEFSLEELRSELKNMDFSPSKEGVMAAEVDQHDHVTQRLWNKKWQIVISSDDSGGFVTTDDPVTIRWTDGQEHDDRPGMAEENSEIIFPLSTKLALRSRSGGEENAVNADAAMVAEINSHIIDNSSRQVFAYDHSFKFARGEPVELRSGATLNQDERFLTAGKSVKHGKVVPLKAK
jgi:hypothetical protein